MDAPVAEPAAPASEAPLSIQEAQRTARLGLAAELKPGAAPAPVSEGTPPEDPAPEPAEAQEPQEAQPEGTPADVPADEPGSDEPEARPADGSESPALTALIDGLDPDARYFLEQRSGKTEGFTLEDVNKAFLDARNQNNRLARFAREEKASAEETADEPTEDEASPEDQATFEPPSDQQIEEKVEEEAKGYLSQDPECERLVHSYIVNTNKIEDLDKTLPALARERQKMELRLEIQEVAEDPIKSADIKDALRDLRDKVRDAKDERAAVVAVQKDLGAAYKARKQLIKDHVRRNVEEQARTERQKIEHDTAITTRAKEFSKAWLPAVERAIEMHKIPKGSVERFRKYAKMAGNAETEGIDLADVESFVSDVGREFATMLDENHRSRSGQYAEKVRARAATTTPPVQPSPGTPTETPGRGQPLSEVIRNARRGVQRDLRG